MFHQRRAHKLVHPKSRKIVTSDEDPYGFGDVFDKEMPPRVQQLSMATWEKLFPTKWEAMKIAKPEILNMHMRMIRAYIETNLDPDYAVRKASGGKYDHGDLTDKGKEFHKNLLQALKQAMSDYPG